MTTATITLTHTCSGGGHKRYSLSIDGGPAHVINTTMDNLQSALTDDEKEAFIKAMVKLDKIGKTWAQVNTNFTNGIQVIR